MNPRLIKHPSILFFSFFILNIHSQFSISGKISDENGVPIIGASIFLKEISTHGEKAGIEFKIWMLDTECQK